MFLNEINHHDLKLKKQFFFFNNFRKELMKNNIKAKNQTNI